MASHYEAPIRKPLVTGDKSYHDVTIDVAAPVEGRANKQWWIAFFYCISSFSLGTWMYFIHCLYRSSELGD